MKKRKTKKKKVVVAMSGGVDSSVAAALLKEQGYSVIGIFMKLWSESYSTEAEDRARKVADILDIPFSVFNFEKEFKKKVVGYFLKEYKQGTTPNPCVVCNKEIKFGLLMDKALKLGVDYVATGHYARKKEMAIARSDLAISPVINQTSKIYKLFKALDKKKDQSYFLWKLNQKQLKHILFPLGNYTKTQVRKMAKKFNLPVLNAPESQEICFIETTVSNFLAKHIKTKPGPILTIDGKEKICSGEARVIGEHQGLPLYTIGQRKGIELSNGPFYVVDKNLKKNILIVARYFNNKNLYKKKLIAKDVNWIAGKEPKLPLKVKVQIRYGHKTFPALIYKIQNTKYEILFISPQRAITPGQSVVFYKYKQLIGGGIICEGLIKKENMIK